MRCDWHFHCIYFRMRNDSGHTESVWFAAGDGEFGRLERDIDADVCVVGAGIAGMSVAYELAPEGRKVVVLDDGPIGGGNTGRTTAHLAFYNDDGLAEIERLHGTDGLRLAMQSHRAAVDRIQQIAGEEKIDCDFRRVDGYKFTSPNGRGQDYLEEEMEAAKRIGWDEVAWADAAPLPFATGRCLRFPAHGQFHPLKYIDGLARAIHRAGGKIYTHSHVDSVEQTKDGRHKVGTLDGPSVTAPAVVFCTNSPIYDVVTMHTKQVAWRSFAIGILVPRKAHSAGLFWDTETPYHYVRTQPLDGDDANELLIVGGEDHKTGQADDGDARFERLIRWTRERFPMAGEVKYRWSGQWFEPIDYLAYCGRNPTGPEGIYIHTGDSGHGMTHGVIAGILIRDLIVGRENEWATLYDPSRKNLRAAGHYIMDNLSTAAQLRDYVTPGDVSDAAAIAPGEGAVVRRGLKKLAVYKDERGEVHECSAVCTHVKCIVHWNSTEKSWDCPCHGSRFDPYGRVVDGPANFDLAKVEPTEAEAEHAAAGAEREAE